MTQPRRVSLVFRRVVVVFASAAALALGGCGYQDFQRHDGHVRSAAVHLLADCQRRAEVVERLLTVVKGDTGLPHEALVEVTRAASRASALQTAPQVVEDADALQRFLHAQDQLTGPLSQSLAVVARHPRLSADPGIQSVGAELDNAQKRLLASRSRYVQAVAEYNVLAESASHRVTAMLFGYKSKLNLTVANQTSTLATVRHGDKPASK